MDAIDILLTRGVDTIYPTRDALEKVLRSGKKLKLYQGFDPTGTQLHIGHAVGFRKLRQWQDLGHKVIFLVGDGTGLAGDPSGKMKARGRFMSREELRENAKAYLMQASKIVRFDGENPVEILYNGDWLTKLTLEDILNIAQNFTVQQMIERDMYQVRMKAGDPINLREFLYPLLQGYDSVAMEVDLELGGSDQTFNMLAGRTLVKNMLGKEKFVMTTPLLADSKGVKIGKTEGNVIGLTDEPSDFYGKVMSLGDDAIIPCFTLLTDMPIENIKEIESKISAGENPMIFKKQLAFELTRALNTEADAKNAQEVFSATFGKNKVISPELYTPVTLKSGATIYDALGAAPLNFSASEVKRQITAGSVELNNAPVSLSTAKQPLNSGDIIQKGKHTFIKVDLTN